MLEKNPTECIIRWTHLWGFMSQPTSVCKMVIPFVQEDRKLNFSSSSSPAKHKVPRPLQYSSATARLEAEKMNGGNKLVSIGQKQVKVKHTDEQPCIFCREWS